MRDLLKLKEIQALALLTEAIIDLLPRSRCKRRPSYHRKPGGKFKGKCAEVALC